MASNGNDNNFVRKDGVIKEQVKLEKETRRNYQEKWGYVCNFNEVCLQIAQSKGISPEEYLRRLRYKKGNRITSQSTWNIPESPQPPITTYGEIGWRSSKLECNLERLGPLYVSPRHTLTPPGSEPEPPITHIFLG